MKNKFKKSLAMLLAVILCVSMLSAGALAADEFDVTGDKTASPTELTAQNDVTTVTLKLPSEESKVKYDVVFVMDDSTSASGAEFEICAIDFLSTMAEKQVDLKVGVVKFKGQAFDTINLSNSAYSELTSYTDTTKPVIEEAISYNKGFPSSGTNLHAGLQLADSWLSADDEVKNENKLLFVFTDGKSYIWNNDEGVATSYYTQGYQHYVIYNKGSGIATLNQSLGSYDKGAYAFDKDTVVYYDTYSELFESDHPELLSTATKYDQRCAYAYGEGVPAGTVQTYAATNGEELFSNTFKAYRTYYEFHPAEAWEGMVWLEANPYEVTINEDGTCTFDGESRNPDFYQDHPDCLQKGTYIAGHLFDDMNSKYNTVAVTYWGSSDTGLGIAQSFKAWLFANADYKADIGTYDKKAKTFSNPENIAPLFDSIKEEIIYMVASGVVEDVIPDTFELVEQDADTFRITLGGEELDASAAENGWNFGEVDEAGVYPYAVSYDAESRTITWTINVPVENVRQLTLSYDLKLTDEAKATVNPGETKSFPTNESAVLAYNTSEGTAGSFEFPVPEVTYSVPQPVTPPVTPTTYTVTYVDGLGNTLSRFTGLSRGVATPTIEDPTREGYVFTGWSPAVADTVTRNATYTAQWEPEPDPVDPDPDPVNPDPDPVDPEPDPVDPDPVDIEDPDVPLSDLPIDIEDPDVPLSDLPVDIDDEDVPKADAPADDSVEIDDEDVPLARTPKTGEETNAAPFVLLGTGALTGLAVLYFGKRHGKHEA